MMKKYLLSLSFVLIFFFAANSPVFAHKVVLFGWVENNMVHVEAGFGSSRPAINCDIKAFDSNHTLVFQGKTDNQGKCIFPVPETLSSDMTLELDAGPGHKGKWTIMAAEFTDSFDQAKKEGNASMAEKKALNAGPSPLKIFAGIALIFILAMGVRQLKKKKELRS